MRLWAAALVATAAWSAADDHSMLQTPGRGARRPAADDAVDDGALLGTGAELLEAAHEDDGALLGVADGSTASPRHDVPPEVLVSVQAADNASATEPLPVAAAHLQAREPRDAGVANASFATRAAAEPPVATAQRGAREPRDAGASTAFASRIANETLHSLGVLRDHGVSEFVEFQVRKMRIEYEYSAQDETNKLSLACLNCCFLGFLGFDRCFMGQFSLGLCKCLTCGGFGALFLVDFSFIMLNCMLMKTKMGAFGFHAKFGTETVGPAFNITSAWVLVVIFVSALLKVVMARRKHAVTQ